ncbi:MAG: universal stress protein [Bacillota bacterium]
MFNNILVAFDGSSHSTQSARFAAEIHKAVPGVKITVITVLTFTRDEAGFLGLSGGEYEKAEKSIEEKYFGEIKNYFDASGVPLTTVVREGDPAKEIVRFAEENGIDHIVIGRRGLGNIRGALLGSVSAKVIHSARCPVTVVKDK